MFRRSCLLLSLILGLGLGCSKSSPGTPSSGPTTPAIRQVWPSTLSTTATMHVRVVGSGFDANTKVTVGGAPVSGLQVIDSTHLELDVAPAPVGTTQLVVANEGKTSSSDVSFGGWHRYGSGIAATPVNEIREDLSAPGAFLATTTSGFYRSTDGGRSWTLVDPALPDNVTAISEASNGTVYLVTESTQVQLQRRRAGELLWTTLQVPDYPHKIYVHPTLPGVVFLQGDAGLWRSSDEGASWTQAAGVSGYPWGHTTVAFSASKPNTMFVVGAASGGTGAGELWRSDDAGATFTRVYTEPTRFEELALDPSRPQRIYLASGSRLLRSDDSGQTWTTIALPDPSQGLRGIAVGSDGRLFAGANDLTGATIYSLDPDATAFVSRAFLPGAMSLGTAIAGGRVIVANARSGVIAGDSTGSGFSLQTAGFESPYVNTVRFVPGMPGEAFAGTNCGLYHSEDSGKTWSGPDPTIACGIVHSVAVSDARPDVLFASTDTDSYRSIDGGKSWTKIVAPDFASNHLTGVSIDPSNPDRVWAGGSNLYRSTDGGANWTTVTTAGSGIFDVTLSGASIVIVRSDGAYLSQDDGATWNQVSTDRFATVTQVNGTLYASSGDLPIQLYSSPDGSSWTSIATNVPFYFSVDTGSDPVVAYGIQPVPFGTLFRAPFPAFSPPTVLSRGLEGAVPTALPAIAPDDPEVMLLPTNRGIFRTDTRGEPGVLGRTQPG